MKDSLKQFIQEHKPAFDDLKAPNRVWRGIEKELGDESRPVKQMWKWYAVAASALLLVAVGYIFGMKSQSGHDIAGWEEYQETERFYEARIQMKMEKIKNLPVGQEVLSDIKLLDEVYEQLRAQLMEDPNANSQLLLSAMIKHQQQKLEVMEEVLDRVEKYKTDKDEIRKM